MTHCNRATTVVGHRGEALYYGVLCSGGRVGENGPDGVENFINSDL